MTVLDKMEEKKRENKKGFIVDKNRRSIEKKNHWGINGHICGAGLSGNNKNTEKLIVHGQKILKYRKINRLCCEKDC